MGIQNLFADGITLAGGDPTHKAARISHRPMEALAWHDVAAKTGNLTTVAAAGAIFTLRNLAANPLIVRRIGIGFTLTTAFTAAQLMEFGLMFCRAFTTTETTNTTAIGLTGSNTKVRTSLAPPTSVNAIIATTAAMTGSVKTRDANYMGIQSFWAGAVGNGITPSMNNLFSHDAGDYPIILAQNEGISIENILVMGAAGVGVAYVNFEVAEAASY